MLNNNRVKATKLTAPGHTEASCGCKNHDWLWSNGKDYCPYCQKPIKV